MIRAWPALALLLWGSAARAAGSDILVVVAEDPGLAAAVVTATSQQYAGPVAIAPGRWSGSVQPGSIKLQLTQVEAQKWRVVMSGPDASVSRELPLAVNSRRLDVAEAVALAVPGMASRLESKERAAKAREAPAPAPDPIPCPKATTEQAEKAEKTETAADPAVPTQAPIPVPAAPPPATPVVEPFVPRWSFGVSPALFLSGETNIPAGGGEVFGTLGLPRDWRVEVSVGGYRAFAWQYNIGMFPLDAFIEATGDWRRLSWRVGVGPELLVATSSIGSGATLGIATGLTGAVHVSDHFLVGVRAVFAYTPGNPDIGPPGDGSIFLSQATFRLGLALMWER